MSKTVLHKASTRGHANHGWLNAHHSFSFANYYDESRIHFGALRVLNDDIVAAGMGFGTHPHDNMEIITIPLKGDLQHKDNMGNTEVIKQGDVQVMSAGTGVQHSEFNPNKDKEVNLLQIWVFPNKKNVTPRYQQITLPDAQENKLQQIVSPDSTEEGTWIHQDAWFSIGNFKKGFETTYTLHKKENGVYVFVIEGDVTISNQSLNKRDALGIWETENFTVKADSDTRVLFLEVPMEF